MDDGQQLNTSIKNDTHQEPLEIEAIPLPLQREEYAELVEAETLAPNVENSLVVAKPARPEVKFEWKQLVQAFLHGIRWNQLKQQFTKQALVQHLKRHGAKIALVGLLWYGVQANVSVQSADSVPAAIAPYETTTGQPNPPDQIPPVLGQAGGAQQQAFAAPSESSFINRFLPVANEEMKKYGIPVSITLGITIVKSEYGTSVLAQQQNNYFQMSCKDNPLKEGIVDYTKSRNNCYVHYENAWTSFRANSLYLQTSPYRGLQGSEDVRQWAVVLEQQGIVTAPILLGVIDRHELHLYDAL